jgi:hypothetical protein
MQSAMDSFYVMLRDRLAALNPGRTIAIRGVVRPGVVVSGNELAIAFPAADCFWIRWTELSVDGQGDLPLSRMRCEVRYWTAGMAGNGGMDRGRLLSKMDAELDAALHTEPQRTTKMDYTSSPASGRTTNVFWTDVAFGPAVTDGVKISRVATVDVFSFEEAGEM